MLLLSLCTHVISSNLDSKSLEKSKLSSSKVFLPELPEDAEQMLSDHNKATLEIFSTYVKTFAHQHLTEDKDTLPVTESLAFCSSSMKRHAVGKNDGQSSDYIDLLKILGHPSVPVSPLVRSKFVSLSGWGDNFESISDLCSSTQQGIFLDKDAIPYIPLVRETHTKLNAYLLDFYNHGEVTSLERANGIRRADVWFVLNDFSMVLAVIVASLGHYLGLGKKGDEDLLDIKGGGDAAEEKAEELLALVLESRSADKPLELSSQGEPLKRIREKVAENWDEEADRLDEDDEAPQAANGPGNFDQHKEYASLIPVYRAFRSLKMEFDGKFKKTFA